MAIYFTNTDALCFSCVAHYTCSLATAAERSNVELDTPITLYITQNRQEKRKIQKCSVPNEQSMMSIIAIFVFIVLAQENSLLQTDVSYSTQ